MHTAELQDAQQKNVFESVYYNGVNVNNLVQPDVIKTIKGLGIADVTLPHRALAADLFGKGDINKAVFHNQFEGT